MIRVGVLRPHSLIGHAMVAMDWAQASPFYSADLCFEFRAHSQKESTRVLITAELWLCSTKGFIIHNPLKSLPQQLPKIPLVRNAIMRRSACFVTHTVSLKRFFFFPNRISVEESKGFSKATPNTEQLIILFLKGLLLQRKSLYLKILEILRFTMLLCCTCLWAERGGRKWIN